MSKESLINHIVEESGISKKEAETAINLVTSGVMKAASLGDDINLIGFGKFSVKQQPERKGRNPQTGEAMTIAAKKVIKFSPGKTLKDACNSF